MEVPANYRYEVARTTNPKAPVDAATVMAKKPNPAPKEDRSNRKTAPVQVKKDVARWVAVVATHDGVTQADLLDPVLRQWALTNYRRVLGEMGRELDELGSS